MNLITIFLTGQKNFGNIIFFNCQTGGVYGFGFFVGELGIGISIFGDNPNNFAIGRGGFYGRDSVESFRNSPNL